MENRITTAITERLSAARNSVAKSELIEELSANLNQKYLELTENGISEEEAFEQVMDSLGDVSELLDYLAEEGEPAADASIDSSSPALTSEQIHTIRVDVNSADVEIEVSHSSNSIDIDYDGDDLLVEESAPGVLSIFRKVKKPVSFFSRLGSSFASLSLTLSDKQWQRIELTTSSGDISVSGSLRCRELAVTTASGDVEFQSAEAKSADVHTASGDITLEINSETLSAGTASGDIEICSSHCHSVDLGTASGDVTAKIICTELNIGTASGDAEITLEQLPKTLTVSTASGDCSIAVPENIGFELIFNSFSGDFSSDMPFSGIRSKQNARLTYLNGGDSEIQVSTASGDLEIYTA